MSIYSEIQKLKKSKTDIRKAIQQNGSSMETTSDLINYSSEIDNFDGTMTEDLSGVPGYNKNSYTQMVLPSNITEIRDTAFQDNTSLKELVLNSTTVVTLGANVFKDTKFENGDGIIYVPDDLVGLYQANPTWSNYTISGISNFVRNNEELYPLQTLDRHLTVGQVKILTVGEINKR